MHSYTFLITETHWPLCDISSPTCKGVPNPLANYEKNQQIIKMRVKISLFNDGSLQAIYNVLSC